MTLTTIPTRTTIILAGIIIEEATMNTENIAAMNKALSRINGFYQKWFQTHTMNSYLVQTLNALYMEPELTQKEVSEKYQIPRQTVNNAVQALKKDGYVELVQNSSDKRWKTISFTDAGKQYAYETLLPLLELDHTIAQKMGPQKYEQLIALLQEYGNILEREIAERTKQEINS